MKGPYSMDCKGEMNGNLKYKIGDIRGETHLHIEKTCTKYTSEDEKLECELIVRTLSGDTSSYEGVDRFLIYPLKGEETLRKILEEHGLSRLTS